MSKYAILLQRYRFLKKTAQKELMKHKTILMLIALILSFSAYSRPARRGIIHMRQPDGSIFDARIKGDEFMRVTTTLDGSAIVQDEYGWWCYATFDSQGNRSSTGWKVGHKVPSPILFESKCIPYKILAEASRERRRMLPSYDAGLSERLVSHTKSGTKVIKRGIIILAQFSDIKFEFGQQDFADMLTKDGYSRNGASGSAKEYFDTQFTGKVDFNFDVSQIVTLPGKRAEYGSNLPDGEDRDPARMIIEACSKVDDQVDFSIYDEDRDGEIDNVFVFFAGGDEADGAGEECIWSHSWYIFDGAHQSVVLDGRKLNRYACSSELTKMASGNSEYDTLTGIGTFCHEYSHTLGLVDHYDTDYEGSDGETAGLWRWTSLMDGGNYNNAGNTPPYFNAIEREMLGICEPVRITGNGTYFLEPIENGNKTYRLDTDNEDEYYLIECRSGRGWDSYIGGSGMLIYHIDRSNRNSGYSDIYGRDLTASERWIVTNEVNCRPDHQCADLIEADGRKDGFQNSDSQEIIGLFRNISSIFFPQNKINSVAPEQLAFWSGASSVASISDIKWQNGGISFNVRNLSGGTPPPGVTNVRTDLFSDAAIISFESDGIFDGKATVEWGRVDGKTERISAEAYEMGKYAVLLEGLEPDNKTYSVNIFFESDGVRGENKTISFMTRKSPAVDWPYIYMNSVKRNDDGTIPHGSMIPLRVSNAADAAEIIWTFNGKTIPTDMSLYYKVKENGILKAHIVWEDGAEETVMKEIILGQEE